VQFLGIPNDDRLIECYQQCDVFALPNRQVGWDFEGFGIVLLEAQACGRPVITGRSGGTAETIDPLQTGVLIPCDEPEPIAQAVCDMFDSTDRAADMGARGRERAVTRFDWTVVTRQAHDVFHVPESWVPDLKVG
jgi:phosphatidylinositol alpha-1,6-mannosyltransferase